MSAPTIPDISKLREYRAYKDHWDTRERHDLKPVANVLAFTPHHGDRVLVRRLEKHKYVFDWEDNHPSGHNFCRKCKQRTFHAIHKLDESVILRAHEEQRKQVGNQLGLIIAVAPGVDEVRAGDVVLYARWPANEFEHEGEIFTFLYEEQAILAVVE